jgi:hypothetical protein
MLRKFPQVVELQSNLLLRFDEAHLPSKMVVCRISATTAKCSGSPIWRHAEWCS